MKTTAKWCWVARETRKGWRLGLCVGNAPSRYLDYWFCDPKDISRVLRNGKTVFVEMADAQRSIAH